MGNDIQAQGIFCHVTDHGLQIAAETANGLCPEKPEHALHAESFGEQYALLVEASKNSIDRGTPFVLMLTILDHNAPYEQQFLFEILVQYNPDDALNRLAGRIKNAGDEVASLSGNMIPQNEKLLLDIFLNEFLGKCENYKGHSAEVSIP